LKEGGKGGLRNRMAWQEGGRVVAVQKQKSRKIPRGPCRFAVQFRGKIKKKKRPAFRPQKQEGSERGTKGKTVRLEGGLMVRGPSHGRPGKKCSSPGDSTPSRTSLSAEGGSPLSQKPHLTAPRPGGRFTKKNQRTEEGAKVDVC